MQHTYIWHQHHLLRKKVAGICVLMLVALSIQAQQFKWAPRNNPNYDDKKLTYGFLIGLHTSAYQIKYADIFVNTDPLEPGKYDDLHSIVPDWASGFSLGFIVNYRLADQVDVRLTPLVGFYEHKLLYRFTTGVVQEELVENTMVELPILLKYKSERRGNVRMYGIGGIKPALEASARSSKGASEESLEIKDMNLHLEAGFGFDLYYPLFKFSPEIRFSRGIVDMLDNRTNRHGEPLKRINTNTISIYFIFQ